MKKVKVKNKILFRLISYFVTSYIVFALIIGVLFTAIFSSHNTAEHTSVQETRIASIANALSEMLESNVEGKASPNVDYGVFMRTLEVISSDELWVVDRNLKPITFEHPDNVKSLYKELPVWSKDIVLRAVNEKSLITKSFSIFSESPGIVTAMPITLRDGSTIGAVMVYSPKSDVYHITCEGIIILVLSIIAAVIVSVFVAAILSSRFTKPLSKMKKAALLMSAGDYTAKTGVNQYDEIGELAAVMDDMADKLEASSQEYIKFNKLRHDYVANISHELRTPVTVIRGSLEALCDGVVTDAGKVEEYHKQMLAESVYLERLVSDMLDLARLQNLDFAIEIEEVDLRDVAEDVIRGMRHIAEQKRINLAFAFDGDNFFTTGDYARLRQMLIIVLDNAIKFSPEGGTVNVTLSDSEDFIAINIRDEGCGISPDDMPYIFDRFYKDRSEENKTGTGLGLAIAKQIADRHNVAVDIKINQGKGTEFVFLFHKTNSENKQR